ncbi:BgTH12-02682 [Blumeria graminis f. sp. triticale]|uniref:BgtE-5984 n=3 Tax=Blumeria graminis TaxID=34373 RepID=A0A061HII9_BLUGR|nr:putative secreted effector protein [Blumeria graminis f. sp. tritici 96224]CAD6503009.1 BgTH12-02682 [Blumeria graminis f. sp. triticale]VDB88941.1 BgtE-5984 [Blumeria graminis f. sp. tritici]
MHCLLAILLLTGNEAIRNDRLAIMNLGRTNENYQIYDPRGKQQFRGVESGSDVMMATSHTVGPGTYLTVYCSPSQSFEELKDYATEGAEPLQNLSGLGFHQDIAEEVDCLNTIQQRFKLAWNRIGIHINELLNTKRCSKSAIYSLGLRNEFYIMSVIGETLTLHNKNQMAVITDNRYDMSDVVLNGKLACRLKYPSYDRGLAWHQGYLNIFQKQYPKNVWYPMKRTMQGLADYAYIIDFIGNLYVEIDLIRDKILGGGLVPGPPSMSYRSFGSSKYPTLQQTIQELLQKLGDKNLRLVESDVEGSIGPFVGGEKR